MNDGSLDEVIKRMKAAPSLKDAKITVRTKGSEPKHVDFNKNFVDVVLKHLSEEKLGYEVTILDHLVVEEKHRKPRDLFMSEYLKDHPLPKDDGTEESKNHIKELKKKRMADMNETWKTNTDLQKEYAKRVEQSAPAKDAVKDDAAKPPKVAAPDAHAAPKKLTAADKAKELDIKEDDFGNMRMNVHGKNFIAVQVPKYMPGHKTDPFVIVGTPLDDDEAVDSGVDGFDAVVALTKDDKLYIAEHTTKYKSLDGEMIKLLEKKKDSFAKDLFDQVKALCDAQQ
jgi:hypothetical protein